MKKKITKFKFSGRDSHKTPPQLYFLTRLLSVNDSSSTKSKLIESGKLVINCGCKATTNQFLVSVLDNNYSQTMSILKEN